MRIDRGAWQAAVHGAAESDTRIPRDIKDRSIHGFWYLKGILESIPH